MKLLLDTHFLIWLTVRPDELSYLERAAIDRADERHVSVVSLWEMRIKWRSLDRRGQRKGLADPQGALSVARRLAMIIEPLSVDDTLSLFPLPPHRDPFDEMLLAQTQRLGARLLTRDRLLVAHPLALQL